MLNAANDSGARSGSKAPRVLTVLPDLPCPATTGLHLRHLSNLDLVHRLGCYSAVLYFTTEEHKPAPLESSALAQICDEIHHGGQRFPHADFSSLLAAVAQGRFPAARRNRPARQALSVLHVVRPDRRGSDHPGGGTTSARRLRHPAIVHAALRRYAG